MAIPKAPDERRSILDTEADINAAPETGAPEDEYVQVASLSSGITSKLARSKTKEILGGLTDPDARLSPEARVTKEAGEMPTVLMCLLGLSLVRRERHHSRSQRHHRQ